jgi:signal transduction histidine kinase
MRLPERPGGGSGLRSLTNKVALLFAGVVLVAFGVVYFYIVPQLRSNLEQQVFDELAAEADESASMVEAVMNTDDPGLEVERAVRRAADVASARVSLLGVQSSSDGGGSYYQIADSAIDRPGVIRPNRVDGPPAITPESPGLPTPDLSIEVADRAVDADAIESGLGRTRGELIAQAAAPLSESSGLPPEWVAIYSRPIEDVDEAVGIIQRQVLVAGVLAVLVALAGGWLVARAVARRVRRLETAAKQVARGRAVTPLPIDSEDELGQLTRAFNDMQEQLARVDRARRDFIANASHELRTPVFSLGGFTELLQDEDIDPETRERFLASMREQIDRLQRLAADLLDLSRLDAGALEIHVREADVAEVARAMASEFEPVVRERGTELALDLPPSGLEAYCDPDRVAQIVRILLDNAVRHNPPGTPVTLALRRGDDDAELTVSDAGDGLADVDAERIFDRFYTADTARGSGLGLAIARELAERMGGTLRLRRSPGETTFCLALPLAAGDQIAAGPEHYGRVDGEPLGAATAPDAPARRA